MPDAKLFRRFGNPARQHRLPRHREVLRVGVVDAEHLVRPGEFARRIGVFPAADLGAALGFGQDIRQSLDLGYIHAATDGAHRIPGGVALDQSALQHGFVATAGIADSIRGGPAAAIDERKTDGVFCGGEVARVNSREPGVDRGFEILGRNPHHFLNAARAMHHAAHDIPFEYHPVHSVSSQPEHLFALRQLEFRQFALGDVAGIDDYAADQRIVERRYVAGLQPAV